MERAKAAWRVRDLRTLEPRVTFTCAPGSSSGRQEPLFIPASLCPASILRKQLWEVISQP